MTEIPISNENIKQSPKLGFKDLEKHYGINPESWWYKFLKTKTDDIEAKKMVDEVDWSELDAFGYLGKGLMQGDYMMSGLLKEKNMYGEDTDFRPERLLLVCSSLPENKKDLFKGALSGELVDLKKDNGDLYEKAMSVLENPVSEKVE